ncbi:MAG: hypothetical protein KC777_20060 [Cyanobacteria bacterium HKST-UBA02]|nr:hypothetical protein [Cyanobacteria bacterium HKST-UBA02]
MTRKERISRFSSKTSAPPVYPWSVRWPVPLFPIDHLLASPDFSVVERRTLEPVGSDHLPVWVVLSLDN